MGEVVVHFSHNLNIILKFHKCGLHTTKLFTSLTNMTHCQWTMPEQADWLKEHLAAFIDSQANKTTKKEFFPQVIKEWRVLWPLAQLTVDEITEANNAKDAVKNTSVTHFSTYEVYELRVL